MATKEKIKIECPSCGASWDAKVEREWWLCLKCKHKFPGGLYVEPPEGVVVPENKPTEHPPEKSDYHRRVPPSTGACNCVFGQAVALHLDALIADIRAKYTTGSNFHGPADKNAAALDLRSFADRADKAVNPEPQNGWLRLCVKAAIVEPARRAARAIETGEADLEEMISILGRGIPE